MRSALLQYFYQFVPLNLGLGILLLGLWGHYAPAQAQALNTATQVPPVWEDSALPALPGEGQSTLSRAHSQNLSLSRTSLSKPKLFGIEPLSRLEEFYSNRTQERLRQFGYRTLGRAGLEETQPAQAGSRNTDNSFPRGQLQDDFVVGRGDRLRIILSGQQNLRRVYEVDTTGRLVIEGLGAVSAAGRKISDISDEISALAASRHNVNVFVSIESVKQITVLILGHVANPGRLKVSAFDSLLDGLIAAGGVDKSGSLRHIKVIRRGESREIDLYQLLLDDAPSLDLSLKDGDRVIIPPIGKTIAISGAVKRPGVYEIRSKNTKKTHSKNISVKEALKLAGGLLARGNNRILHLEVQADGSETTTEIPGKSTQNHYLNDASLIMVGRQKDKRKGEIILSGHTTAPGSYDLQVVSSLGRLLTGNSLYGPDIYPLIGVIERRNPENLGKDWIAFAPYLVTKGEFDRRLLDGDHVRLFSTRQIRRALVEEILEETGLRTDIHIPGAQTIHTQRRPNNALFPAGTASPVSYVFDPSSGVDATKIQPELHRFLKDYALSLKGAVRHPGLYPVAEGVSLNSLLSSAGGLLVQADRRAIEITSQLSRIVGKTGRERVSKRFHIDLTDVVRPAVLLGPGDSIRIKNQKSDPASQVVLIRGEVRYPGEYDLAPGDRLSDLIDRAGGLNDQAYPAGAIFSRAVERRREESAFRAQAQELELSLARKLEQEDNTPGIDEINSVRSLITRLKNAQALGRITVEADPVILESKNELDILLEARDKIYIPKRPLHVRVRGEVLSPSNLQFRKNKDVQTYIREAGGFTERADEGRSFVVFPDGSAQPLNISPWAHNDVLIPPGSTVVVPLDAERFSFLERVRDISQILTNLTISAVFLDDIKDD